MRRENTVHHRNCVFCHKTKCFFSRGNDCTKHSRIIKVQAPCAGLFSCPALSESFETKENCPNPRVHYICSDCFQKNGGHLYERGNKPIASCTDLGNYNDDESLALKHYGNWLISMAELGHQPLQRQLLLLLTQTMKKECKPVGSRSGKTAKCIVCQGYIKTRGV